MPFKFMQLSETNGMLSWGQITFTPASVDASLDFTQVPQQFLGTGTQEIRANLTVSTLEPQPAGPRLYYNGTLVMYVATQQLAFWIGAIAPLGSLEGVAERAFSNGREYRIEAGSAIFERVFA